ncbi:MAG: DUF2165 domain-containing protein [Pseudomonas sp.]|uniref:DUF2165 family protein n=1 Tax=Pseudomonas sp. TaxID=306 RepID=UPI0030F0BB8F
MVVRIAKVGMVVMIGLFLLLVGVDNLLDYGTNYAFVQHVMMMDTLPPQSELLSRAIHSPLLHKLVYAQIIAVEMLAGLLCVLGAARLWLERGAAASSFNRAKHIAIAGLALAFALWFFGFMVIGGEWFQMWRSPTWNGQQAAFRFIGCVGLVLLFLSHRDEEFA